MLTAQLPRTDVTANIMSYGPSGEILTEINGGVKTDYAYLDGFPIAAIQPGASTVSYIHTDRLGTPQRASNAAKAIVWTGNYDPNGAVTPTTSITMNLRFPGQYADPTGLNHNGFRDYIPGYAQGGGRYGQVDPIGLAGGINPFVYGLNNPYKYSDPSGLGAGTLIVEGFIVAAGKCALNPTCSALVIATAGTAKKNNQDNVVDFPVKVQPANDNVKTQEKTPTTNPYETCPLVRELPENMCTPGNRGCIYQCLQGLRILESSKTFSCRPWILPIDGTAYTPRSVP